MNVSAGMEMVTILKVFCYMEVKPKGSAFQVYMKVFM